MICEYEERIALYIEGDLTADESVAAEDHMAVCPDCASLAGALQESQAALKSLAHAAPGQAIRARVLATLELRRRRRNWLAAAAALFVIVAAALAWNMQQRLAVPQIALRPPQPPAVQQLPVPQPPGKWAAGLPRQRAEALPERPRAPVRRMPEPKPEPVQLARNTEPLVVKMLTDDPDVVIIWLVDGKEQQNEETSFGDDGTRGE
jgi:hypothetical protein